MAGAGELRFVPPNLLLEAAVAHGIGRDRHEQDRIAREYPASERKEI